MMDARSRIRTFLAVELLAFAVASLIHAGVLVSGWEHKKAHVAETVIALVLLVSLAVIQLRPASARTSAIAGQGFALFGTLVGLLTIAIGVGPRTVPDVVYHVLIVCLLVWGIIVARRSGG